MIFIDFNKGLDTLEWNDLFNCLEVFNLSSVFIHYVKMFCTNIESCVINNGSALDYLRQERVVSDKETHSPLIFFSLQLKHWQLLFTKIKKLKE